MLTHTGRVFRDGRSIKTLIDQGIHDAGGGGRLYLGRTQQNHAKIKTWHPIHKNEFKKCRLGRGNL